MSVPTLPKGTVLLENQVAGHTFQDSAEAIGMLRSSNEGYVFKPLTKPACAEREKYLYKILSNNTEDPILQELKQLVPEYYTTEVMHIRGRNVEFIKLSDITYDMPEPCIIDIKIGERTWDPSASDEKRMVESSKYVRCKKNLGFCIPGFQVSSISAGKLKRYGKEYGKGLDENTVIEAFKIFLNADSKSKLCRPLVAKIFANLLNIQNWAQKQRKFNLYASSVLIVYDAKRLKEILCGKDKQMAKLDPSLKTFEDMVTPHAEAGTAREWVQVKMIDFAHTFSNEDGLPDENYINGINHLVNIFRNFLQEC